MKEKSRDKKRRKYKRHKKYELNEFVEIVLNSNTMKEMKEKIRVKQIYG